MKNIRKFMFNLIKAHVAQYVMILKFINQGSTKPTEDEPDRSLVS